METTAIWGFAFQGLPNWDNTRHAWAILGTAKGTPTSPCKPDPKLKNPTHKPNPQPKIAEVLEWAYLEGQGGLVTTLITPITHIVTRLSHLLTYLLSLPEPKPSTLNTTVISIFFSNITKSP